MVGSLLDLKQTATPQTVTSERRTLSSGEKKDGRDERINIFELARWIDEPKETVSTRGNRLTVGVIRS